MCMLKVTQYYGGGVVLVNPDRITTIKRIGDSTFIPIAGEPFSLEVKEDPASLLSWIMEYKDATQ